MKQATDTLALGIDIGGTTTTFGFVNNSGIIIARGEIDTTGHDNLNVYLSALHNAVENVKQKEHINSHIFAIGVGAPCANSITGEIENAVNLPWPSPTPLMDMMQKEFELPVRIANDANAATIGEMTYGAAHGMKNFIMLTLGTGIGSGIVADGHLLLGTEAMAGELGHIIVRPNGRTCGCGRNGCLETYCSATGLVRTTKEMLSGTSTPSLLRDIPIENITSKDVYEMALRSDKLAIDIFNFTGAILGEACANYALFSAPEAIILFGGLAQAGEILLKPTRDAFNQHLLHIFKSKIEILSSQLNKSDAAILGASALATKATI